METFVLKWKHYSEYDTAVYSHFKLMNKESSLQMKL